MEVSKYVVDHYDVIYDDHMVARSMAATSPAAQEQLALGARDSEDAQHAERLARVRLAAETAAERARQMGVLRKANPTPRRDLSASYIAAEESLIARDSARAFAAAVAGDRREHGVQARLVVARCLGLYTHPTGARAARALVGGDGETASGWRWPC